MGEKAYGSKFRSYVTTALCTQQLAICTVFFSFMGGNLASVVRESIYKDEESVGAMTLCNPRLIMVRAKPKQSVTFLLLFA